MKIKKGDKVKIIKGKDKGKEGNVVIAFPQENKILVEGVNVYKKHRKAQGEKNPGGIFEITKPIKVENVMVICPKCVQSVRIGYKMEKNKDKVRICKQCKEIIN